MSSSISNQASPYLIQHANQPVNWLTWTEKSLEKAQADDKPILLSIGYASCHWCQEMSRNCFEDEYLASLMNRHFICILVDREERPELDHLYMEAIRMFDQSAGWPLHAFCLPDGRPFWGGTYFPREDLGNGLAPWSQVLIRISEHYRKAKHELLENAENVIANLSHSNHADCSSRSSWNNQLLGLAADKLCEVHDDINGGFTPAPKFPSPMKIDFLLSIRETNYLRTRSDKYEKINQCIKRTLDRITTSGIYDHLGGGFFRYCNDEKWTQPHYEKMLSDNALLLSTFSNAYRTYRDENFHRVISGTISWLNKEMGNPEIGYASSLSAETEGIEGAFYEWTQAEMEAILGKAAKDFFEALPESPGNENKRLPQLIDNSGISIEKQLLWICLLEKHREKRTKPRKDDKRLLAHNSLTLSAFIQASIALEDDCLLEDALRLEKWISSKFIDSENNLCSYIYLDRASESQANLDDYCFWTQALLDLYSVSTKLNEKESRNYLKKAIQTTEQLILNFKDARMPGFFFTQEKLITPLPCRKKIWYDNATPSGNSMLLKIFSTLYHLTKDKKWKDEFDGNLTGYPSLAQKVPDGICHALSNICNDAIGVLSIQIPESKCCFTYEILSKLPARPIFLRRTENDCEEMEILNNKGKVFITKDPNKIIEFINEK